MSTAQLVREARRGRGLSQRALASRAGLRQPALADIERGAHDTRGGQLDRLVNAAGYRLAVLPTSARSAADWGDLIYQELRSPDSRSRFRSHCALPPQRQVATAASTPGLLLSWTTIFRRPGCRSPIGSGSPKGRSRSRGSCRPTLIPPPFRRLSGVTASCWPNPSSRASEVCCSLKRASRRRWPYW
jgi:transcriptional regulator with XRE-family HTH domain